MGGDKLFRGEHEGVYLLLIELKATSPRLVKYIPLHDYNTLQQKTDFQDWLSPLPSCPHKHEGQDGVETMRIACKFRNSRVNSCSENVIKQENIHSGFP